MSQKKEVSRQEIFENMAPTKAVLTLAIPTILNQLVNIIYNLADTYFIGKLNNASMVAALSICSMPMIFLTACGSLLSVGGCAVIAKAIGAKDMKRAEDVASHMPLLAIAIGAVVGIAVMVLINPVSWFIGASESNFEYVKQYLFWVMGINAIPNITGITLGSCLRGRGYSKYEMFGLSFGNILNIILDPVFIFIFNLGVRGAAIATFLSSCSSLVIFIIISLRMQKKIHMFTVPSEFKFSGEIAKDILATGFPAWLHQTLTSITNTYFMNHMKLYSDAAIAAFGISRKIEHVAGQAVIGLNTGCIPLISYNLGNKNFERLNAIRKKTVQIGLLFGAVAAAIIFPFAEQFTRFFINDAATIEYGKIFVRIYAFLPLAMCINNNARTVFQALGEKKMSNIISVLRSLVLFVPMFLILEHFFGVIGLCSSTLVIDVIVNVVCLILMNRTMKRIKARIDAEKAQEEKQ